MRPGRDQGGRCHQGDRVPHTDQEFSQGTAHIIMVVIVNNDASHGGYPRHQVIWRVHGGQIETRDWLPVTAPDPVTAPTGTRGGDHTGEPCLQDVFSPHPAARVNADVRHLLDLGQPPIDHPPPLTQAGKPGFCQDAPSHFEVGFR